MSELPPNMQDFNTVVGLIFAQLYKAFPEAINIDRFAVARAMGVPNSQWATYKLPSGTNFLAIWTHTIGWLNAEGFIRAAGDQSGNVLAVLKGWQL